MRGADQLEGRVLRVDRAGLLVDWGARLGAMRHPGRRSVTGSCGCRGRGPVAEVGGLRGGGLQQLASDDTVS